MQHSQQDLCKCGRAFRASPHRFVRRGAIPRGSRSLVRSLHSAPTRDPEAVATGHHWERWIIPRSRHRTRAAVRLGQEFVHPVSDKLPERATTPQDRARARSTSTLQGLQTQRDEAVYRCCPTLPEYYALSRLCRRINSASGKSRG